MPANAGSRSSPAKTVVVTGATGFIGRHLTRRLHLSGWTVRALVRDPRRAGPGLDPVSTVVGSLQDIDSLRRLVRGASAIIHCAGAVRGRSVEEFDQVNAEGVARLAAVAADQEGVERFLLFSSLAAKEPGLSHYAGSKRRGEDALLANARSMEWAIFRPPAVYGPGDRELLPLLRWMARGIAPVLGPKTSRFSMIFVDDLVTAACRWLDCPGSGNRLYELHDGTEGGYSWDDLVGAVESMRGRSVVRLPISRPVLIALANVNLIAARIFGGAPMLSPGKVNELRHSDWVCDNGVISGILGWQPTVALREGLALTLGSPRSPRA